MGCGEEAIRRVEEAFSFLGRTKKPLGLVLGREGMVSIFFPRPRALTSWLLMTSPPRNSSSSVAAGSYCADTDADAARSAEFELPLEQESEARRHCIGRRRGPSGPTTDGDDPAASTTGRH